MSQLVMKNNLTPPSSKLEQTNVIYEFTCLCHTVR